ncbi:MAG: endonuclease domain-containing protein [Candidatus Uhrbacteria bacterium]
MTELFNQTGVKKNRQQLRKQSTKAEEHLWNFLRNRKLLNKKFRRQVSVGQYVVDFYCPEQHLIVEIDGEIHNESINKFNDLQRQEFLESLKLKVLRFKNSEVLKQTESVLKTITNYLV